MRPCGGLVRVGPNAGLLLAVSPRPGPTGLGGPAEAAGRYHQRLWWQLIGGQRPVHCSLKGRHCPALHFRGGGEGGGRPGGWRGTAGLTRGCPETRFSLFKMEKESL